MDPFSITAGVVGIVGTAIPCIVQLHELVVSLADADDVVKEVGLRLGELQQTLKSFQAPDALIAADDAMLKAIREDLQKAGVTTSVNNCGETCLRFSVSLKEWTKHSTLDAGKLSKRDRFTIGVWERETIRTFSTSVQVCQANVQLALAAAQM